MFDSITNPWLFRCKVRFIDRIIDLLNCAAKTRQSARALFLHLIDRRKPGYSAQDGGQNIAIWIRKEQNFTKGKKSLENWGVFDLEFFRSGLVLTLHNMRVELAQEPKEFRNKSALATGD